MDDKKYWIGFSLVKGVGSVRLRKLAEYFGDLELAWNATLPDLIAAGATKKVIENLITIKKTIDLDTFIDGLGKKQINYLFSDCTNYPKNLSEIEQHPPVLYFKGTLLESDLLSIGIVGTRKITYYGKQVTDELSTRLAQHGVTVVSGLARGVDAVAHQAAVRAKGRTIAVLGSGVDVIYPPEHKTLAKQIEENGAILSDYPPGTQPDRINFPPRNRIISGLSRGVVVVEAGEKSGALITADFAADQGREVFAVPGPIYSPQSVGPNALLSNGANIYTGVADIFDFLKVNQQSEPQKRIHHFDGLELALMEQIGNAPVHIDDICANSGIPVDKAMAYLTILELNGHINQVGVMNYVLNKTLG
jgi:DNA processing protein